jgi:hypothetical protein
MVAYEPDQTQKEMEGKTAKTELARTHTHTEILRQIRRK